MCSEHSQLRHKKTLERGGVERDDIFTFVLTDDNCPYVRGQRANSGCIQGLIGKLAFRSLNIHYFFVLGTFKVLSFIQIEEFACHYRECVCIRAGVRALIHTRRSENSV